MTLEVEKLSDLSQVLEDYVREKGADANGKNKLNLDEELDLETLSLETVKVLNAWRLLEWTIRNLSFISRIFMLKVLVPWGRQCPPQTKISKGEASFEVVAFGQGRWATEFSQTKT